MPSLHNIHTLEIDSVELSFGERIILSGIYLRLDTGKITALLGSNGSGKSCLMRIIFNELKPTYKSFRIDSIWQKKLFNNQVLYLPQIMSIPKYLKVKTVFDDFKVSFSDFKKYFHDTSISEDMRIEELSAGEQRIIEIFIILRSPSQFVMLDEPFSQIMPLHISIIKSLIIEEKARKGILLTDHLYHNVVDIADSTYVIANRTCYHISNEYDLVRYGYISNY